MTDTPPNPSAPNDAMLEQAAKSAASQSTAPPSPTLRMVRYSLADLIATITGYAAPAMEALAARLRAVAEAETAAGRNPKEALRHVAHFAAVREWCAANPDAAARVVMCAVYLADTSAKVVVQEELVPEPPAGDGPKEWNAPKACNEDDTNAAGAEPSAAPKPEPVAAPAPEDDDGS